MIRLFFLTVLWLTAAQALAAQDAAHLIADRIVDVTSFAAAA